MSEPRKPFYKCDSCSTQQDAIIGDRMWNLPDGWYEFEHRPPETANSEMGSLYHACSRACLQSLKAKVLEEKWEGPIRLRRVGAGAELPRRQ
jgi:hypothetical protein